MVDWHQETILADRRLSALDQLVYLMVQDGLTSRQIASLLARRPDTIRRALGKLRRYKLLTRASGTHHMRTHKKGNNATREGNSATREGNSATKRIKRTALQEPATAYPEAVAIVRQRWLPHAPLPSSVTKSPKAQANLLNQVRLIHTQGGLTWDQVGAVVEYAARHWQPQGYCQSPAALYGWTKDKSCRKYERILHELERQHPSPASQADAAPT
ncbi:MAG: hypothetical protein OXI35_10115, partial [Gemmatimonadota bacterium]|nr:hypothetical protein [Gemmatimonadota bacterium]